MFSKQRRSSAKTTISIVKSGVRLDWQHEGPKKEEAASVVYENENLGVIHEGVCFTFAGTTRASSKRFFINLTLNNSNNDIALLVNPYLSHNCIVCSSRVWGRWINKQQFHPILFKPGSDFYIQILITDVCYMIAANGHHIAEYNHQVSPREVRCIVVKGDVENLIVLRGLVVSYPDRLNELRAENIPLVSEMHQRIRILLAAQNVRNEPEEKVTLIVPYVGHLPQGLFKVGRCLRIDARVSKSPREFSVSLQKRQDLWPQPVVALQFQAKYGLLYDRLQKNISYTNAYFNGQWMQVIVNELGPELREDKLFNIFIVLREHAYEIYLNRKKITEFVHRIAPNIVDTVYIRGDIELRCIELNHRYMEDSEVFQNKEGPGEKQKIQKK